MADTRVALVTGGASGIGEAVVAKFLAEGWDVLLCYFGEAERSAVDAVVADAAARGRRVVPFAVDVTKDAECRAAAARAGEAFGRLDALVSSAGTTRIVPQYDLDALQPEDFELTARVNTLGPFQIVRACTPLLKAGGGTVVIISSYGGLYGGGSSIAYAASKGATNTLTLSLARVLAPEIRVNAVCPALVSGGFVERDDPAGFAARVAAQTARAPLAKVATPAEVAADIYWLAAGTTLMTGNVIALDCGMHLNGDVVGRAPPAG